MRPRPLVSLSALALLASCESSEIPSREAEAPTAPLSDVGPSPASAPASSSLAPSRLRDVVVPPDFDFQATRPFKIRLSAAAGRGSGARRRVELQRPDGVVLFRGSVTAAPLEISFPLPSAQSSLRLVTFDASGARASEELPVPPTSATLDVTVSGS